MEARTDRSRWQQVKGEVARRWTRLSEDDVERIRWNAEALVDLLQRRYGYERARAQREILSWRRALIASG